MVGYILEGVTVKSNYFVPFVIAVFAFGSFSTHGGETPKSKFKSTVKDEKAVVVDMSDSGAIDPTPRIRYQSQGNFYITVNTMQMQMLHLSHFPSVLINGRFIQQAGAGGRFEFLNAPLPKGPGGKQRNGQMSSWLIDDVRIVQTVELHPSKAKAPGQKRNLDTVLITYTIENKGKNAVPFGMRVYMDTYVIDNDGCMYASPTTHKGKILDGMILQEKTLPSYLQMLQRPDLQNPGYIAHLTLNMGGKYERPTKLVLTRHGTGFGAWDMPAAPSMGDSAIGIFWATKDLKPGMKRELAYAYGENIAVTAESEGRFEMALGGSFEPGKQFTVSAIVADAAIGQAMTLELPPGIELVEGRATQPVPPIIGDAEYSTVLWKARVLQTDEHTIRIRSSTGVTQSKVISVSAVK